MVATHQSNSHQATLVCVSRCLVWLLLPECHGILVHVFFVWMTEWMETKVSDVLFSFVLVVPATLEHLCRQRGEDKTGTQDSQAVLCV